MENAVEALKIAFAVMMFVMALSLSISSFSQATSAVSSIIEMRDRETEYTYVEPSADLTRVVGIETIIPTMYRAYEENIQIYFFDKDGNPLLLYYKTDNTGQRVKEDGNDVGINYIDLAKENFGSLKAAIEHLDILLSDRTEYTGEYQNQIEHSEGLYKYLSQYRFKESLGEYYQGSGATQTKKRVITYTIVQ